MDDPLDAFPLHGCCGMWGVLATGIFCTDANVQYARYPNVNDACKRGEQFAVQIIGVLAIAAWSSSMCAFTFLVMKHTMGLRVTDQIETEGLDRSEHGMDGYGAELFHGPVTPTRIGTNRILPSKETQLLPPPPAPAALQPAGLPPHSIEVGS